MLAVVTLSQQQHNNIEMVFRVCEKYFYFFLQIQKKQ